MLNKIQKLSRTMKTLTFFMLHLDKDLMIPCDINLLRNEIFHKAIQFVVSLAKFLIAWDGCDIVMIFINYAVISALISNIFNNILIFYTKSLWNHTLKIEFVLYSK